jgi:hypothetical protein
VDALSTTTTLSIQSAEVSNTESIHFVMVASELKETTTTDTQRRGVI